MEIGQLKASLILENGQFKLAIKDSENSLRVLERNFDHASTSAKRFDSHFGGIAQGFRHFVVTAGAARFALMDINDVFLSLPAAILRTTGEFERLEKLMAGLSTATTEVGRNMEAATNVKWLQQMSQQAPFALKSMTDAFVKFKSAGLDPTDGSLQALIDGVAKFGGSGELLSRASVAIQQMAGKGVISMEELRQQLGEATPTAMRTMATSMGLSMGELADKIKKGVVTAIPALDRMLLLMGIQNRGAAANMMDTWVGMLEQLKSKAQILAAEMGNAGTDGTKEGSFAAGMKVALADLLKLMNDPRFKNWAFSIVEAISTVAQATVKAVRYIIENADTIWSIAKTIGAMWLGSKIIDYVNAMRLAIAAKLDYGRAVVATAAADAAAAEKRIADDLAATAVKVRAIEAERAMTLAHLRTLEADYAAHQVRMTAMMTQRAERIAAVQNRQPISAALANAPLAAGITTAGAQMGMLGPQIEAAKKLAEAQRIAALEAAGLAVATARIGPIATLAGSAMTGLTAAVGGLRVAFFALGGWFTVIAIAIQAGIALWFNWGKAAEEAAKRANNARRGLSTAGELKEDLALLAEANQEVARLQAMKDRGAKGTDGPGFANAMKTALENQKRLVEQTTMQQTIVNDQAVRDQGQEMAEKVGRAALAAQNAVTVKYTEGLATLREKIKTATGAAKLALEKELTVVENKQATAGSAAYAGAYERANTALDGELSAAIKKYGENSTQVKNIQALQASLKTGLETARAETKKIGILGTAVYGDAKPKKEKNDGLIDFIAGLNAQYEDANLKLEGLLEQVRSFESRGVDVETLRARAFAHINKKIATGAFDGHLPDNAQQALMAQTIVDTDTTNRAVTAFGGLYGAILRVHEGYQELADTIRDGGRNEMPSLVTRLATQLSKLSSGLVKGSKDMTDFEAVSSKVQGMNTALAAGRMGLKLREENRKIAADLIIDPVEKIAENAKAEITTVGQSLATVKAMRDRFGAESDASRKMFEYAEDQHVERIKLLVEQARRAMRTPVEQLAETWQQSFRSMETAQANWMTGFVDTIVDGVAAGKIEVKKFVVAIVADLAKIKLRETLAAGMGDMMKSASDWLSKTLDLKKPKVDAQDVLQKAAADALAGKFTGLTLATSLVEMEMIELANVMKATIATLASQTGIRLKELGVDMGPVSDIMPNSGGTHWADALYQGITPMALGGIVGPYGNVPLRKYARGGIADRPQLALFGEGAHKEAYVPLQDGRSIPVTMSGAGAPSVEVNVINQSGQPVGASQGQPRFDGKKMILDVVLTAMNQPGAFRDGVKGAMVR